MERWMVILFALCWFAVQEADGQERKRVRKAEITGTVVDEQGKPLPYATVAASLRADSLAPLQGTLASESGFFRMELPGGHEYVIAVRHLGYHEVLRHVQADSAEIALGSIALEPSAQMLEGVTVKPALTVTADKIIYNFENDKDRATSNMMQMIKRMPLILVDEFTGKVSVESPQKTYIVLRNGREDALFSRSAVSFDVMLEKLPAMGFTQFEIWSQPPPRYAKYDYVIKNLADKKQRLFGAVGKVDAGFSANSVGTDVSPGVTGSADKLRFSANAGFSDQRAPASHIRTEMDYFATDSMPGTQILQEGSSKGNSQRYKGGVKMSYDLGEKQFVNLDFNYNRSYSKRREELLTDSTTGGTAAHFEKWLKVRSWFTNWNIAASYQYDLKKGVRVLNLSYLYRQVDSDKEEAEETAGLEGMLLRETDEAYADATRSHRFQVDYTDNFSSRTFYINAGVGYLDNRYDDHSHTVNTLTGQEDSSRYSAMRQTLRRVDGYAELTWNPVQSLSFKAGVTGDYVLYPGATDLGRADGWERVKQYGALWTPEASMQYMFNTPAPNRELDIMEMYSLRSTLNVSYRLRRVRPRPEQLSNYTDVSNPAWVKRGNPELEPVLAHGLHARLSMGFLHNIRVSLGGSYDWSKNQILPYSYHEMADNSLRLVNTYTNAKVSSYNLNLTANWGYAFYCINQFSHSIQDLPDGRSESSILSLIWTYYFDRLKFLRVGTTVTYMKYFNTGVRGFGTSNPFVLGFTLTPKRIKIGENYLNMSVSFSDVLNWKNSKYRDFIQMDAYEMESIGRERNLPISFSLSYSFGKFKVKPLKMTRKNATITGFVE